MASPETRKRILDEIFNRMADHVDPNQIKDVDATIHFKITDAPVPFLKLVTGQDSGPAMFMAGRLKIAGDLIFARRMTSFFRIPSA